MINENPKTKYELNSLLSNNKFKQNGLTDTYSFTNSFTDEEIEYIIDYCASLPPENAEVGDDLESDSVYKDIRSSIVRWVPMNEETKFIYERLIEMVLEANNELWGFDVSSIVEEIQYTEYYGTEDGHYDWHLDIGEFVDYRKISITVQLSDETEYDGGNLSFKIGPTNEMVPIEKGLSSIFPSYILHRVNKVNSGVRRSLVLWVSGPPFR